MKRFVQLAVCLITWAAPVFAAWSYQATITLGNSSQIPASQTNFTVLVCANLTLGNSAACQTIAGLKGTGSGGYVTSANGYDIIFSTTSCSSPTTMYFQMPVYTSSSGAMEAWVMVSSLAASGTFYMCVGNSGISTFQGGPGSSAFASSYQGVWHLPNGTTLSASDALGYNSSANHNATAVSGQIDGGAGFVSTSSQYIDTAWNSTPGAHFSISCWAAPNSSVAGNAKVISNGYYGANYEMSIYAHNNGGGSWNAYLDIGSTGGSAIINDTTGRSFSTWHLIDGTYDGSTLTLYVDGTSANSQAVSGTISAPSYTYQIGRMPYFNQQYFDGSIDECRIATATWSANWIKTEYNNQSAPSSFMTIGSLGPLSVAYTAAVLDLAALLDQAAGLGAHYPATLDRSGIADTSGGYAAHIASTASCASPNCPAPAIVGTPAYAYGNSSNTLTISYTPQPDDSVVVTVTAYGASSAPSITSVKDNLGNLLAADAILTPGSNWLRAYYRYVAPKNVTGFTVTISQTPSDFICSAIELQGPVVLDAYDTTGTQGTVANLGTASTNSFTTTNVRDLVMADGAIRNPVTFSPLAPWTALANAFDPSQPVTDRIEYYYTSAAQSVQGKMFNGGVSSPYVMSGVAYYSVAGYPGELNQTLDYSASMAAHFSAPREVTPTLDATARMLAASRAPADTFAALDAPARLLAAGRAFADASAIADASAGQAAHFSTPLEALATLHATAQHAAHFALGTDLAPLYESGIGSHLKILLVTDALSLADLAGRVAGLHATTADPLTMADAARENASHFLAAVDRLGAFDGASQGRAIVALDALVSADAAARLAALHLATADAVFGIAIPSSSAAHFASGLNTGVLFEFGVPHGAHLAAPLEAVALMESGSAHGAHFAGTLEGLRLYEFGTTGSRIIYVTTADAAFLLDSGARLAGLHAAPSDLLASADAAAIHGAHFPSAFDVGRGFDLGSGRAAHFATASDTGPLFDLGTIGQRALFALASELAPLWDAGARVAGLHTAPSETLTPIQFAGTQAGRTKSVFESARLVDAGSGQAAHFRQAFDINALLEAVRTGQHAFLVTAAEFALLRENPSLIVTVRPPVLETSTLAIYQVQVMFASYPAAGTIGVYPVQITIAVLK